MKRILTFAMILLCLATGCVRKAETKPLEEKIENTVPIDLLADTEEKDETKIAEEAEDILYSYILEYLVHALPQEALEEIQKEKNCLYAVTLAEGTVLEYLEGCTLETTEESILLAVKYQDRYYLSLPFGADLRIQIPNTIVRTEETSVSPNTVFTAEEDLTFSVEDDEVSRYLKVKELSVKNGAECRLDILYKEGIAHLCGLNFSLEESAVKDSRLLGREDLLIVWYEDGDENLPVIDAGNVVYRLLENDMDGMVLVGGGHYPVEAVDSKYLYAPDIEELKKNLPKGEYAFITYGNYCSIAAENSRMGLVRAENKIGERNETAVYFEAAGDRAIVNG